MGNRSVIWCKIKVTNYYAYGGVRSILVWTSAGILSVGKELVDVEQWKRRGRLVAMVLKNMGHFVKAPF